MTEARKRESSVDKWIADRNARRVPTFVQKLTGIEKKANIVEVFGEGAVFMKGEPLPTKCETKCEGKEVTPTERPRKQRAKKGKAAARVRARAVAPNGPDVCRADDFVCPVGALLAALVEGTKRRKG